MSNFWVGLAGVALGQGLMGCLVYGIMWLQWRERDPKAISPQREFKLRCARVKPASTEKETP